MLNNIGIVKLKHTKCGWRIFHTRRTITKDGNITDTGYGMAVTNKKFKSKQKAIDFCTDNLNISRYHIIDENE